MKVYKISWLYWQHYWQLLNCYVTSMSDNSWFFHPHVSMELPLSKWIDIYHISKRNLQVRIWVGRSYRASHIATSPRHWKKLWMKCSATAFCTSAKINEYIVGNESRRARLSWNCNQHVTFYHLLCKQFTRAITFYHAFTVAINIKHLV